MRHLKFNLLLLFCILTISLKGQTLHTIVICNTEVDYKETMKMERENVLNQIQQLGLLLEYDWDLQYLKSSDCTREKLKKIINEMDVKPEDVVLTFYSGYGNNDGNTPWPQYCMKSDSNNQESWVKMTDLEKWVAMKNPRLRVVLSNCCNIRWGNNSSDVKDRPNEGKTEVRPLWNGEEKSLNAEHYKSLFSVNGSVMSTASKLGEYSWMNEKGGIYTQTFWDVMSLVGKGKVAPDWESVLDEVYQICSSLNEKQHPYYEIMLDNGKIKK